MRLRLGDDFEHLDRLRQLGFFAWAEGCVGHFLFARPKTFIPKEFSDRAIGLKQNVRQFPDLRPFQQDCRWKQAFSVWRTLVSCSCTAELQSDLKLRL
jgi:hypothetical protein